jgi:alcohol dehydrogenase
MMNAFRFQTVPTMVVEFGAARRLGALLRAQFPSLTRLCVVTDGFLHKSGLLNPALADLAAHGWNATVIDDVIADPPEHIVLDATSRARQAGAEIVLGLGGGSSMDVAKLIAVLAPQQEQALSEMYGVNKVTVSRLPLVQMPTTAGTGSEVTAVSIVTVGEAKKMGVVAPQLVADLAILDAELTLGLPVAATAATGVDAMVHAIEAYTSAHLKNPVSDMLAVKALDRAICCLPARTVRIARPAKRCCSARRSPDRRSPIRRWPPCMRSRIRSVAFITSRTVFRMRSCCHTCCASTPRQRRICTRNSRT